MTERKANAENNRLVAYQFKTAMRGHAVDYRIEAKVQYDEETATKEDAILRFLNPGKDTLKFLTTDSLNARRQVLHQELSKHKTVKVLETLRLEMTKDQTETNTLNCASGKPLEILSVEGINDYLTKANQGLHDHLETLEMKGSGWVLTNIISLDIHVTHLRMKKGGMWVDLPKELKSKKALINVNNADNECFKWAVLCGRFTEEIENENQRTKKLVKIHWDRLNTYTPYINRLNFEGLQYPVSVKQIDLFEKNNPSISINLFMYESPKARQKGEPKGDGVMPLRLSKELKTYHINLLIYGDHYVWIKNMSRLLADPKHNGEMVYCYTCMSAFTSSEKLVEHQDLNCDQQAKTVFPTPDKAKVIFKNYHKQLKVPFTMYADFESLLLPTKV